MTNQFDELRRDWDDISSEQFREYDFGDEKKVRIEKPARLNVSESGSHRILDCDGNSHYVPAGWVHIMWRAEPAFVK